MADTNMIRAVWAAFFTHIKQLEGATGNGSSIAVRRVVEGESALEAHPIPYVLLKLTEVEPTSRADNDKIREAKLKIRVVTIAQTADGATSEILSKIAQVDDKVEAFIRADGVAGFENNKWGIAFNWSADHGNIVAADSELSFGVRTARGGN
ncbi:MAG TPA: hypothetical protein VMX97_18050 [Hyphomicrobiaceae bacterium]|nr:hypothetical protein [Hyphomicrobiaceae bacterium]